LIKNNKYLILFGNAISLLSIFYLLKTILQTDSIDSLSEAVFLLKNPTFIFIIVVLMLLGTMSGIFLATPLYLFLKHLNRKKIIYSKILFLFFDSNLAKYIPGNIFHYVKRQTNAKLHFNISHIQMAKASLYETIAFISSFFLTLIIVLALHVSLIYFIILLTALIALIALKDNPFFLLYSKSIYSFSIFHLIQSMIFICILSLILPTSINLNNNDITILIIVFTLSNLIGFVTPGSPGGIGVREVLMYEGFKFINSNFQLIDFNNQLILGLFIMRLINIFSDCIQYLIVSIFLKVKG
jgi:glycosyltransferase 2 family protein